MGTTTTYFDFESLGVPYTGMLSGGTIFIVQDEHTRQYHTTDPITFKAVCDGSWEQDPVMRHSFTGNIAIVDPITRVVAHIYDSEKTPPEELEVFNNLIAQEIARLLDQGGNGGR
jgi:hypothetical protein